MQLENARCWLFIPDLLELRQRGSHGCKLLESTVIHCTGFMSLLHQHCWHFVELEIQSSSRSSRSCFINIHLCTLHYFTQFFLLYPKDLSNPLVSSCQGSIFGASTLLVTAWSAILSSPRGQSFLKKTTTAVDDAASRWPKAANLGDDVMEQTKKCWETTWNDVFITIFGNDEHFINPHYVTKLISCLFLFFLNPSFWRFAYFAELNWCHLQLESFNFPSAFLAGGVPGQYGDSPL